MIVENCTLLYVLISLVIWFVMEISGSMAKASNEPIDGTSKHFIIIILWGPLIVMCLVLLPAVILGFLINKARKVNL